MTKKSCKHPDGKTLLTKDSCHCRRLKCMVCSMTVRWFCSGHGSGHVIENPGRK